MEREFAKDRNYLPHLTSPELADALEHTRTAIMPVGSTEQHGPALPLGTDTLLAFNVAREAARRANVICVPSVFVGLSSHHMGFPGSLTLSRETFVQVLFEVAGSLARHGFERIVLYNGHGGNEAAMAYAADLITKSTSANAILFGIARLRSIYLPGRAHLLDIHAGVGETSAMLNAHPELVESERIEKPEMRLEPKREKLLERVSDEPELFPYVTMGLPDFHEISSNGCITYGDPHDARADLGKSNFAKYVDSLVALIRQWEEVDATS